MPLEIKILDYGDIELESSFLVLGRGCGRTRRVPTLGFLILGGPWPMVVDTGYRSNQIMETLGMRGLQFHENMIENQLGRHGVRMGDVRYVMHTHLHIDHLGWNTNLEGNVFFPRARYAVHADALAFARTQADRPHIRRCVEPLLDRFETVTGDVELAPGVTAFSAAGHYPGHMAVRLESDGETALLIADSAVHPALLDEPDWVYVSDGDPNVCAETRRGLLPELVDRDVLVACGHYPGSGIGRVVTRDGRVVWEEARARVAT